MELDYLDYEILTFINQFEEVNKAKILEHFTNPMNSKELKYRIKKLFRLSTTLMNSKEVEHRLKKLSYIPLEKVQILQRGFHYCSQPHDYFTCISHGSSKDCYKITSMGYSALNEYLNKTKKEDRRYNLLLGTAILTLIVSLLTLYK